MTGTTMGSLYYMSPEQIQGSATLDARADLYSVGVSLYELVTGKRPFDGDSQFAIMSAHLEKAPVPPITLDPKLPQGLNDIILMAVLKDPAQRFQTAAAFRNALAAVAPPVLASPPVSSIPTSSVPPIAAAGVQGDFRLIEPTKPESPARKTRSVDGAGRNCGRAGGSRSYSIRSVQRNESRPEPQQTATPSIPPAAPAPVPQAPPPEQAAPAPAVQTPVSTPVPAAVQTAPPPVSIPQRAVCPARTNPETASGRPVADGTAAGPGKARGSSAGKSANAEPAGSRGPCCSRRVQPRRNAGRAGATHDVEYQGRFCPRHLADDGPVAGRQRPEPARATCRRPPI